MIDIFEKTIRDKMISYVYAFMDMYLCVDMQAHV